MKRKPRHQELYEHAKMVYMRDAHAINAWAREDFANAARAEEWASFYFDARRWCNRVGVGGLLSIDTTAKVLAATSPLKSWGQNKAITRRIVNGESVFDQPLTMARKLVVAKILEDPLAPFPESGVKTWNFYHNIISPYTDHVTIDRHMIRPVLDRVSCSRLEYDALADAIRFVTRSRRKPYPFYYNTPSASQALLWAWYRTDGGRKPDRM